MNIDELQDGWNNQFNGGQATEQLVARLYADSRQSRIQTGLGRLVFHSVLYMIFNLFVLVFSCLVLVEEIENWAIVSSSATMIFLTVVVFYMNVSQLDLIARIDFSKPIVKLQRTIERLKLKRVRHNRFIFVFCVLYFWLGVTLFFRWDLSLLLPAIWAKASIVIIVHVGFLLVWFPVSLWLIRLYEEADGTTPFVSWLARGSYLTDGSLNATLNASLRYLTELEAFESGKDQEPQPTKPEKD